MDKKNLILDAKGCQIEIVASENQDDYISLTDIAFEFASWISPEFNYKL